MRKKERATQLVCCAALLCWLTGKSVVIGHDAHGRIDGDLLEDRLRDLLGLQVVRHATDRALDIGLELGGVPLVADTLHISRQAHLQVEAAFEAVDGEGPFGLLGIRRLDTHNVNLHPFRV